MIASSKLVTILVSTVALVALVTAGVIGYQNSPTKNTPLIYAKKDMLQELWTSYKYSFIEPGSNRTLDKQQNNISTSESQSYTMLRAVWMDDQKTFDDSWQWTKDNLQRSDHLMSWKFGQLPNGKYGIQETVGGSNTASDGDSDISLSLLMAYSRWKQDKYLYDAKPILASMWAKEVVSVAGAPVLVANDLERNNAETVIVNPSYLSPYAYKVFANVDKTHDWTGLANNSYTILGQVSDAALNTSASAGLPPDWVTMNRKTGSLAAPKDPNLTTRFSFDAVRTPWRLALDYKWYGDSRSQALLAKYKLLATEWKTKGQVVASYTHDGKRAVNYESPSVYGATIGYFSVIEPAVAKKIYADKLSTLYSPDEQKPMSALSYYDANWSWFGSALYLDQLPNLTVKD